MPHRSLPQASRALVEKTAQEALIALMESANATVATSLRMDTVDILVSYFFHLSPTDFTLLLPLYF